MLLNGSNNRGARGQTPNRSRAFRGRGSTSRGASNSSGPSSRSNSPNPFELDRLDNAAKREQRGQNGIVTSGRGGRGTSRGSTQSKHVRFSELPTNDNGFNKGPSPTPPNPFAAVSGTTIPSSTSSILTPQNPFAAKSQAEAPINPFTPSPPASNPFGLSTRSKEATFFNPTSHLRTQNGFSSSSEQSSSSAFGVPSTIPFNPFAVPADINGRLDNALDTSSSSPSPANNPFGTPAKNSISRLLQPDAAPSSGFKSHTNNPFATPAASSTFNALPVSAGINKSGLVNLKSNNTPPNTFDAPSKDISFSGFPDSRNTFFGAPTASTPPASMSSSPFDAVVPSIISNTSGSALAQKLDQHLRKQGITPPKWPTPNPGDPSQKNAVKDFWMTPLKRYRNEVRESLIKAGYLDDPDKPKKLSEAIDFKGTCEDMCPEFEKFTRIVDTSVDSFEKERKSDGTMWPLMGKMVKALARSSAGQEAPLPMDVRTPAALRRTLDYLLNDVLGDDDSLPKVHGFLWNRTRAIRRDFIFQQSAMHRSEMVDQIYCLERITRFHVIALHQMSRQDFASTEDYSEQQEVEQLGKSLLSLIHAYEDCNNQNILCENEAEFRAYYILFNNHNTAILETVQDWGLKFWRESDNIKTAVALVEALQNIWDRRGPLKPYAATDIAHNAFTKFFSIVQDRSVSYTMACFAEVHFKNVRKAIFQTILTSYRKQRDQTKDWTLSRLNGFMRFDNKEDIISFGEAYGLNFEETDGEDFLSFESGDEVQNPFPPLKQCHSRNLVERKRGRHSLAECMDVTIYEEVYEVAEEVETVDRHEEPTLGDTAGPAYIESVADAAESEVERTEAATSKPNTVTQSSALEPEVKPTSLFDSVDQPTSSGAGIFTLKPTTSAVQQNSLHTGSLSTSSDQLSFLRPTNPTSSPQSSPFFPSFQTSLTGSGEAPKSILSASKSVQEESNPSIYLSTDILPSTPPAISGPAFFNVAGSAPTPISQYSSGQFPAPNSSFRTAALPAEDTSPSFASTPPATTLEVLNSGLRPPTSNSVSVFQTPTSFAQKSSATDQKERFSRFADWYTLGKDGIIDQFTAYQVERILKATIKRFMKEEATRFAQEADDLAKKQADEFRYMFLATKYGNMWREGAHRLWLKRRAREARQARKQMTESLRASKAVEAANLVKDFKASTRRRNSLESSVDASSITDGGQNPKGLVRETVSPSKKRQRLEKSKDSPLGTSKHKRGRSENPLRRSLLSDPSYLTGGSRIHLLSSYGAQEESRRHVSGVQTDYFRLKARGIATLPDGQPLANAAAKDILHNKTAFDGVIKPATPKPSRLLPGSSSVPSKYYRHSSELSRRSVELEDEVSIPRLESNGSIVVAGKTSHGKRSVESINSDEELFARSKRVREQMDERAKWFRKQIYKDTASRSVS